MQHEDPLQKHFRLSPPLLAALGKIGIRTIRDLFYHFPARYEQGGKSAAIAGLVPGTEATIFGTIHDLETRKSWKRKIPVGEARLRDATGSIKIMWFHQPYLAKKYAEGMSVKAVGTIGGKEGKIYLANPHVEPADPTDVGIFAPSSETASESKLFAVYPESRGVSSLWFRHALERVFKAGAHELEDPIPGDILDTYHLPALSTALVWIHTPENLKDAEAARKRFAFEEMYAIQVKKSLERAENAASASYAIPEGNTLTNRFLATLPFPPTNAQQRAIQDILFDFTRGYPMARLLEGDVGSGKTAVAAATAYATVCSRPPGRQHGTLQVAYMAPTEILARQHFESFIEYFKDLPINIALMTGSGCQKFPSKSSRGKATPISRAQLLKWVENGEIAMLVGTHALIQKSVQFQHLAYCIVDEQHRFGTRQRAALLKKPHSHGNAASIGTRMPSEACLSEASSAGRNARSDAGRQLPHFLSMTATPIPRTLALTMYGDLDLSILDELPPGRAQITTKIIRGKARDEAYQLIRTEIQKGRQAYIICPRIEEPDPQKMNALQAKSAKAEMKRLQKDVFAEYTLDILHGAMKPTEKDAAMARFADGTTHILVATSVVEVGINVPNATIILIEGAERFGLAQLHQLRGRVQRSSHPPLCLLASESGPESMKRLRALEASSDGFKLAETDLHARGAGDLFGRKQWGVSDIGMEALKNVRLIKAARTEAERTVASDPSLLNHSALRARIDTTSGDLHEE